MNYIVAADSFKGSLSSNEVNQTIKEAILEINNQADVLTIPVCDGGEGFYETIQAYYSKITKYQVNALNANGHLKKTTVLIKDKTCYIESAQVIGIIDVINELDILKATSYGLGQAILAGYQKNIFDFVIGLGGTATSDLGLGLLQALGAKLYDNQGDLIKNDTNSLFKVAKIDLTNLLVDFEKCSFTLITDIDSTLCGPYGAAQMFAKQKGANDQQINQLEAQAFNINQILQNQGYDELINKVGGGAAGGISAMLQVIANVNRKRGGEWLINLTNITTKITPQTILITGEGTFDNQTLQGKGPGEIAKIAKKKGAIVIGLAGKVEITTNKPSCFDAVFPITNGPQNLSEALDPTKARKQIKFITTQIIKLINNFQNTVNS